MMVGIREFVLAGKAGCIGNGPPRTLSEVTREAFLHAGFILMGILLSLASLAAGFAGLVFSADKFVLGASTTARNLGVSPLVIGLTIVAFGTSAPEIFTSAVASFKGAPELAIGNAIGSNIANLGLVLGLTVFICPVIIPVSLFKHELPILLLVTGACFFLFQDLLLNWVDGLILLVFLVFFVWSMFRFKTRKSTPASEEQEVAEYIADMPTSKALGLLLFGLVVMLISSNLLVSGAKNIALALGVGDLVVGLTIVAIGTSLPELATSLTSALKGEHDLAIGNIVGSNILNLLLVLPVPAFISPVHLEPALLWRDYSTMLIITLLFCAIIFILEKKKQDIGRASGMVLLLVYLSYTVFLFFSGNAA